jgi:predicted  nucleic acid-binding Zn-ribbon protein
MVGKITIEVKTPHSSQECSKCGYIDSKNRIKTKFCCLKCGFQDHADVNASKVIAKRVLDVLLEYKPQPKQPPKVKKAKQEKVAKKQMSQPVLTNNSANEKGFSKVVQVE